MGYFVSVITILNRYFHFYFLGSFTPNIFKNNVIKLLLNKMKINFLCEDSRNE